MADLSVTTTTSLTIDGESKTIGFSKVYSDVDENIDSIVEVTAGDSTNIYENVAVKTGTGTVGFKHLLIKNTSPQPAELVINYAKAADLTEYVSTILLEDEFIVIGSQLSTITAAVGSATTNKHSDASPVSDTVTDGQGDVSTSTFFGLTATNGIVRGSVAIAFYDSGYQEFGLTNATNKQPAQTSTTDTELAISTDYRFDLSIDGTNSTISFTTDSSDVTWGDGSTGGTGVLSKIRDAIDAKVDDGTYPAYGGTIAIQNGDIRISSNGHLSTSTIILADGTTGTETQLFGAGKIPAIGDVDSAVAATVNTTESNLLLDNGDGTLTRSIGGSGTFDYTATGTLTITDCPANSNFKVYAYYNSEISGAVDTSFKLKLIEAKSLCPIRNATVRVVVFN